MGLIHLPRAYFNGFTYWDPSTMNNNDYQPVYDPANARLNWPWLQRHGFETAQQYDQYATTPTVGTPNEGANVNYVSGIPPAEWNYYGGNNCGFVNPDAPVIEQPQNFAKPPGALGITGFTNPAGTLVTSGDPWIGLPLQLNLGLPPAKLVDVDPVCPWSSQIFCDTINLAAPGDTSGFVGETAGRAHSRWVFFLRNVNLNGDVLIAGVGSAVFQFGIRTSQLQIFDQQPAAGSLASDLIDVLVQPGVKGLMVRFVQYLTIYFQGPAFPAPHTTATCWPQITQLYAEYLEQRQSYESGQLASPPPPPVNRAYSSTVGWIAPWFDGELHSAPGGRMLAPAGPVAAIQPTLPQPTLIGPAVVEVAASPADPTAVGRIAIDLGSTMPEYDATATKIDFGTFNIGLAPLNNPRAPATTICSIPYAGGYDTPTYTRTSGVVDVPASAFVQPITMADLQSNVLVGWFGTAPNVSVALQETAFTAQTDDRGVYVNQPNAPWATGGGARDVQNISIQVRYLGGKPPAGALLGVGQYSPAPPGFIENGWSIVTDGPSPTNQSPYVELFAPNGTTGTTQVLVPVPFTDDGLPYATVTIGVRGIRPGPPIIAFYPMMPGTPQVVWTPPASVSIIAMASAFFANVRVLPFHNEMATDFENWLRTGPTIDVVSQRVFDDVFRTFYLMYPRMRFLGDPLKFQAWRGRILETTDPAAFESARFMPVTRSLSAGQRRMLELWNTFADGSMPTLARPAIAQVRRG